MGAARLSVVLQALLGVLLLCGPLAGGSVAREDLVGALIEAHRAGRADRFGTLAAGYRFDPWFLADALLARGAVDVAVAYAARPGSADPSLAAYARAAPNVSPALRTRFARVRAVLREGKPAEALALSAEGPWDADSVVGARLGLLIASAQYHLQRTGEAFETYRRVIAGARRLGWLEMEVHSLRAATVAARRIGAFAEGTVHLERILEIERLRGRPFEVAGAQNDQAAFLARAGDTAGSLGLFVQAYRGFTALGEGGRAADAAMNAANVLVRRGEYAVARDWIALAGPLVDAIADPGAQAHLRALRATVQMEMGAYDAASADLERVVASLGEAAVRERGDLLAQWGLCEHFAGRHPEAIALLNDALALRMEAQAKVEIFETRALLASARRGAGDLSAARRDAEAVLAERTGLPFESGWVHLELARIEAAEPQTTERTEARRKHLADARRLFAGIGARDVLADVEQEYAIERSAAGDPMGAYRHVLAAIEHLDASAAGLSDEPMARVRARRGQLATLGLRSALAAKRHDLAVEIFERWRAHALLDALGGRTRLQGAGLPVELAREESAASAAVTLASLDYRQAERRGLRSEIRGAFVALEGARAHLVEVQDRVRRGAKRMASLRYPAVLEAADIRARLAPDEAIVYLALLDGDVHAMRVTAAGIEPAPPASWAAVDEALSKFEDCIRAQDPSAGPLEELAGLLRETLALPASIKRVLVCPEGRLCYVPWPALFGVAGVRCVPSASALGVLTQGAPGSGKGVLAVGAPAYGRDTEAGIPMYFRGRSLSPLEGAEREIRAIAQGVDDVRLTGPAATEARLRMELEGARRWRSVLFACHGLIDREYPSLSALALSAAAPDDGYLSVTEILGLSMPTDLVVLSACDSGLGPVARGEGVLGLTRAFLIAGASQVMVSLWKVDDEATALLMETFHTAWGGGMPAERALATAQEAIRRHPKKTEWHDPRYWAAWVLWGDSR